MSQTVPYTASCAVCRWWVDATCHHHAPKENGWPPTEPTDFCGDWETNYDPIARRATDA